MEYKAKRNNPLGLNWPFQFRLFLAVNPNEDWYGLGMDLYETISSHPEVNSAHNWLKHFLDNLEMEFLFIMHGLCKKDTRVIPKIDDKLVTSMQKLREGPDWTLVQPDKTGQWIPIRIIDYIVDMEIHLHCYSNEINRSQLDWIYKDTTTIVDEIEVYCSDGKANFLRSWVKTKKIPSVCLFIKDHKPLQPNGRHPTRLIVSAHNFTQCLSKLASKLIKCIFRRADVNFKCHTLKNLLALKRKLEEIDISWGEVTIASLDIKDL